MLLVVGGTGDLGGRVVRLLVDRGVDVRCLVRGGTRIDGVDVVRGDLRDVESLRKACEGVETVVATATAIARRLAGVKDASIRDTDEAGMLALVDAAADAGVRRFVYVSYAGLDGHIGVPLEHAKLAVEDRLKRSGLRRVIVRPDAFQEIHLGPPARFDLAGGKVAVIGTGKAKVRWVSTDDVAGLIASVSIEADPPTVIEFGGPDALSKKEAIALAEEITHRRLKVQRIPEPVARLGARVLSRRNDAVASLFGIGVHQSHKDATWDDEPLRVRGIAPRSTLDYLKDEASRLAGG